SYLSIPRRPDVYLDDKLVERQYKVSAISRYSFAWGSYLLDVAAKKTLDAEDLPRMDSHTRSVGTAAAWKSMDRTRRLWKRIFLAHRRAFIRQFTLMLFQAFSHFAPQFAMLQLLRLLERRVDHSSSVGFEA